MKASLVHSNMIHFRTPYCATRTILKGNSICNVQHWPHKEQSQDLTISLCPQFNMTKPTSLQNLLSLFYFGSSVQTPVMS